MGADAPVPDLAAVNRAALWLAYFRRLQDEGISLAAARQAADARFGLGRGRLYLNGTKLAPATRTYGGPHA